MQKSFLSYLFLALLLLCAPSHAGGKHDFSFKVSRGDAFYKFFFSTGLSGDLLTKLMSSDKRAQRLNNIYPGDKFRIILNDDHSLKEIVFSPLNDNPLNIYYNGSTFSYDKKDARADSEITYTVVKIQKSLNYDAKKAGVDAEVIKMMVDHFSWEIDFSRDLRKGDRFVLSWNGGNTPEAMIYIGDRKTIALFSHKDSQGRKKYYTSNGLTINETFAFAPVKYSRISSGFSKRR